MALRPGEVVSLPSNFEIISKLGKGGFGTVYKVKHKVDKNFYALKCIRFQSCKHEEVLKELKCMTKLIHKNVIRYYSSFIANAPLSGTAESNNQNQLTDKTSALTLADAEDVDDDTEQSAFAQARKPMQFVNEQPAERKNDISQPQEQVLYIQMQLCSQTLTEWLRLNKYPRDRRVILSIFNDVVEGLAYIHGESVRHSDLRADNVLFTQPPDIRAVISDFGISSYLGKRVHSSPSSTGASGNMDSAQQSMSDSYSKGSSERALELDEERKIDIEDLGKIFLQLVSPYEISHELTETVKEARKTGNLPAEVDGEDRPLMLAMFAKDTTLNASDILAREPLAAFRSSSSPSASNSDNTKPPIGDNEGEASKFFHVASDIK